MIFMTLEGIGECAANTIIHAAAESKAQDRAGRRR